MSEPAKPYRPDDPVPSPPPRRDEPTVLTGEPLDRTAVLEDDWVQEYEELPPRPRRRLITPLNLALLGVLLVAAGFIGGVLVEKGQVSSTPSTATGAGGGAFARRAGLTGTGGAAAGGAGAAGRGALGAGAAANLTTGTVSVVDHGTLYVTDAQGNTIKVTGASGGTVTRTDLSSVSHVRPGDTVIVSGPKAGDGSIEATSIRATAADAPSGGFASLFGGAGGGAGASGGGGSSGAASGSSGSGGSSGAGNGSKGTPSLFGPG